MGLRDFGLFRALSMSGRPLLAGGRRRVAPLPRPPPSLGRRCLWPGRGVPDHSMPSYQRFRGAQAPGSEFPWSSHCARPRGLAARPPPGALIEHLEVCRGCLEGLERFWRVGRAVGWSGSR